MPAYVLVEIEIEDAAGFEAYRQTVPATVASYGGRYLVRGGTSETLEGDWQPGRLVVLEFPDRARARAWWDSAEYAPARRLRQASARTRMVLVDGV